MIKAGDYIYAKVDVDEDEAEIHYVWGINDGFCLLTKVNEDGVEIKHPVKVSFTWLSSIRARILRKAQTAKGWCFVYYSRQNETNFFGQMHTTTPDKPDHILIADAPTLVGSDCIGVHHVEWRENTFAGIFSEVRRAN